MGPAVGVATKRVGLGRYDICAEVIANNEMADLGHREIFTIETASQNMFDMLHCASNRSLLEP
ncbi:hypothetical protein BR93DRAFT_971450 [Coniochaeta sp. PMI_546]|nr:hypothetical protein BR93DRAFT_971450 [Coniochaeta sp. PMI_546]